MIDRIIYFFKVLLMLPIALLSIFIYKLALQPAIHQFYKPVPNMTLAYILVLIAALVHAVLLGVLVVKIYPMSQKAISIIIGLGIMLYSVQMTWLSQLSDMLFWITVWLTCMLVWMMILGMLRQLMSDMADMSLYSHIDS